MVNLMDWSKEMEGWWIGVGMGEEEGRMEGKW